MDFLKSQPFGFLVVGAIALATWFFLKRENKANNTVKKSPVAAVQPGKKPVMVTDPVQDYNGEGKALEDKANEFRAKNGLADIPSANDILKFVTSGISYDERYDVNKDGRVTSFDASLRMRGKTG